MRHYTIPKLLLLAVVFIVSEASAAIQYQYVFDQAVYTAANPGDSVVVNVLLRETFGPGDSSLLNTLGLTGAGVRVNAAGPSQVAGLSGIVLNPSFDDPAALFMDLSAGTAGVVGATDITVPSPPVLGTNGSGVSELLVATFTYTAGAAGSLTTLVATDFDAGLDHMTLNDLLLPALDSSIANGSATLRVLGNNNAIPEPTSLVAWSVLSGMGYLIARRRAKR